MNEILQKEKVWDVEQAALEVRAWDEVSLDGGRETSYLIMDEVKPSTGLSCYYARGLSDFA